MKTAADEYGQEEAGEMSNATCAPCNDLTAAEITARGLLTGEVCSCAADDGHARCMAPGGAGWQGNRACGCAASPARHPAHRIQGYSGCGWS
jgi:hypothetical protein